VSPGGARRSGPDDPVAAVERAFREERGGVLAVLIAQVGDFQLAEDAVQDAFAAAVATWPRDGVPANPGAWITTAARRRAIDRLRRTRSLADRTDRLAALARIDAQAAAAAGEWVAGGGEGEWLAGGGEDSGVGDDRLRLIFTCCHPALGLAARTALTLRMLGGLSTGEIARAFLVSESTMGQRISRAKAKIAVAGIPYRVPTGDVLPDRLRGVLGVVYLIFNEGYSAASGDRLVRGELCSEAIRLGRLLARLMPDDAEVLGLLALMLLGDARRDARVDELGRYMALDEQARARWDAGRIREGQRCLERALRLRRPGSYQLQAAIAALHLDAPSPAETDWAEVAALYGRLAELERSPVVELNRAVAVGFASGPRAGLELLGPLLDDARLAAYQPLHAAHAELLRRAGDRARAGAAYERAISLSANSVERAELERRLRALAGACGAP
jgi:RNA polymerase sigma-70 factor (ECF subfamily)